MADAGYSNGFDAGELYPWPPYFSMGEAIGGYLAEVGIKTGIRTMERAAFYAALASKKLRGLCVCINAVYGNAASRMAETVPSDGAFAYGGYPDVDALYKQQAREPDRKKREALLRQIQQVLHERVRFGPIYDYIWPSVVLLSDQLFTMPIGLVAFQGHHTTDWGPLMAGYTLASLPLVILFAITTRTFIEGLTQGGLKL